MADYTYKIENDEYVFYEDGEVLKTPHDAVVKTNNEDLAKQLLKNLENNPDYTSPTSLLTYHYAYCNLNAEFSKEFIADDFSRCASYDTLMDDDYLMFRQPSPVRQAIAVFFEKELPENFHNYNMYQLSAVLIISTVFRSWMLSQYIIADIILPYNEDEDVDYDSLKEEFLDDLEEYESEELGWDPEDETYEKRRQLMSDTIEAFAYYFTLQ